MKNNVIDSANNVLSTTASDDTAVVDETRKKEKEAALKAEEEAKEAKEAEEAKKKIDGNKFAAEDLEDKEDKDKKGDDDKGDDKEDKDKGSGDGSEGGADGGAEDNKDSAWNWEDIDDNDLKTEEEIAEELEAQKKAAENGEEAEGAKKPEAKKPDPEEPKRIDDLNKPDDVGTKDDSWKKTAYDLGIQADTYEDFIEKAKTAPAGTAGDTTVAKIDELLKLTGESLIRSVLKDNPEYTDEDVDEYIEIAKTNNNIKFEEKNIRNELNKQKTTYNENLKRFNEDKAAKQQEYSKRFETDLKEKLSKTESLLGGQIGDTQRDAIFNHITGGKLQEALVGSVDKLVDVAFFDLYQDKVIKALKQQGASQGRKDLLDNLTPNRTKSGTRIPINSDQAKTFDPNKFLDEV